MSMSNIGVHHTFFALRSITKESPCTRRQLKSQMEVTDRGAESFSLLPGNYNLFQAKIQNACLLRTKHLKADTVVQVIACAFRCISE